MAAEPQDRREHLPWLPLPDRAVVGPRGAHAVLQRRLHLFPWLGKTPHWIGPVGADELERDLAHHRPDAGRGLFDRRGHLVRGLPLRSRTAPSEMMPAPSTVFFVPATRPPAVSSANGDCASSVILVEQWRKPRTSKRRASPPRARSRQTLTTSRSP